MGMVKQDKAMSEKVGQEASQSSFGLYGGKNNEKANQNLGKGKLTKLPVYLTSYDFLKAAALILMIIDHIGFYFFPEEEWFRVIGRFCVPIWFFLIGYARSRDLSTPIWAGLLILVWFNIMSGMAVFPLNVLFTIIVIRMFIDWVADRIFKDVEWTVYLSISLVFLAVFTILFFEYGTVSFFFAILGYAVRHREKINWKDYGLYVYTLFSFMIFSIYTELSFGFGVIQLIVFAIGTLFVLYVLLNFKRKIYKEYTKKIPQIFVLLIQIMGRHTLLLYVIHLALFKLYAVYSGDPRFEWFRFIWM